MNTKEPNKKIASIKIEKNTNRSILRYIIKIIINVIYYNYINI